ncbi:hypothetical protein [Xenorhabdus doucetiae]|uniref:hypothetical protein n=1 Tax=Xenorhabdus doucetiae TaxID=351671 RepID=UPI0008FFD704|nr:hypothetical protein [Xenorhabdus doucetiae]
MKQYNKCIENDVSLEVIYSQAKSIHFINGSMVINQGAISERKFDKIIICPGVSVPNNIYGVNNESRYFSSPYPLYKNLSKISSDSKVAIIGTALTAIDIVRALMEKEHSGEIIIFSRSGRIPRIRNEKIITKAIYSTPNYVDELLKKGKIKNISDIYKLIKDELDNRKIPIYPLLKWFLWRRNAVSEIKYQLSLIASNYEGMEVALNVLHPNIENLWESLPESEKRYFNDKIRTKFMLFMNPMPLKAGLLLFHGLEQGTIYIKKDVIDIKWKEKLSLIVKDESYKEVDYIFNATSPSYELDKFTKGTSDILSELIDENHLKVSPFGGISVNPENGSSSDNIYFLGHITTGVHLLTNSLVGIKRQANRISNSIFN